MPLPYSADEGGEEGGHGPCVSTRLLLSNYDSPTSTLGGNSAERCVLLNYLRDAHLQSTPLPIFEPFRAHSTDKMSSEKKDKLERECNFNGIFTMTNIIGQRKSSPSIW